jgi:hypothetical protein
VDATTSILTAVAFYMILESAIGQKLFDAFRAVPRPAAI